MRRLCLGSLLCFSSWVWAATPQNAVPTLLTLEQAIGMALSANPDLRHARLQRSVEQYEIEVAKEQLNPSWQWKSDVNTSSTPNTGGRGRTEANTALDMGMKLPWGAQVGGNVDPNQLALELKQPLLKGFGRRVTEAPIFFVTQRDKIGALQWKQDTMRIVMQVIVQYRRVQELDLQRQAERSLCQDAKESLEHIRARIEAGRNPANDSIQAEFELVRSEHTLDMLEQSYERARNELRALIGMPLDASYEIESLQLLETHLEPLEFYKDTAYHRRPDVAQMSIQSDILERERSVAENQLKWDLNVVGRARWGTSEDPNNNGRSGLQKPNTFAGVELTIPMGQEKTRKAALFKNKIAYQQWQVAHQTLQRQVSLEVENAWNALNAYQRQRQLSEHSLSLARSSLEMTRQKYDAGRAPAFELVHMQQQLEHAERQCISDRIQEHNALTYLHYVSGMIDQEWGLPDE